MRDQLQKNPDISYVDCQKLCTLLSPEKRKVGSV